jgi:hypothetical protein
MQHTAAGRPLSPKQQGKEEEGLRSRFPPPAAGLKRSEGGREVAWSCRNFFHKLPRSRQAGWVSPQGSASGMGVQVRDLPPALPGSEPDSYP